MGGNIVRSAYAFSVRTQIGRLSLSVHSPGFLDIQINGAYGFDFSIYDGDDEAYRAGLKNVAEKIVETGVTS